MLQLKVLSLEIELKSNFVLMMRRNLQEPRLHLPNLHSASSEVILVGSSRMAFDP
jgi:hypothetical protein